MPYKDKEAKRQYDKEYHIANRQHRLSIRKKWKIANPDKVKEQRKRYKAKGSRRIKAYGISPLEWDELFERQGSVCGICGTDTPTVRGWHTDHCHDSGVVRGILCLKCNVGLGYFNDNSATLRKAVSYLEKHRGS